MNIEVRMFMKYRDFLPPGAMNGKVTVSLKEGSTFSDLLALFGMPVEAPKLVVINGISHGISDKVNQTALKEGDVVAVFPPAGGG
jgi:molybdopterin converting factor small subunit